MHRFEVEDELVKPNLKEDINQVKENLRATSSSIYQTVQDAKLIAKGGVGDSIKTIKQTSAETQQKVNEYVKTNPIKLIAVAFLTGFVSAKIL